MELTPSTTTIGFVGLGRMGGHMAARFLDAGYTAYGEDRSREHSQPLVDAGLRWCATPREVARTVDVIFTSLPDDATLRLVGWGPDGILAGIAPGAVWVDMSTVSPTISREAAERAGACGVKMLDAPVSGSVPQVRAGTLTIMVGGDKQAYDRVEPLLRELGSPTHVGDNGQGLVLKLAINISLAVQMLAFSEGLLLAERAGLDPELARNVIMQSPVGSPMLKARAELVFDLPDEAWFDVSFMHKDIELARETARELRVAMPAAAAADGVLESALDLGYGRRDIAALFEVLGRLSNDRARSQA